MRFDYFQDELNYWLRRDLWWGHDAALILCDVIPESAKFEQSTLELEKTYSSYDLVECETFSMRFDQRAHKLDVKRAKECEAAVHRIDISYAGKIDLMRQEFEDGEKELKTGVEWVKWAISKNYSIAWLNHALRMGFLIEIKELIEASDSLQKRYLEHDSHYKTTFNDEYPYRNSAGEEIPYLAKYINGRQIDDAPPPVVHPWGSHNTKLLMHLSDAAIRFWSQYDPSEPDTAPTNKAIEDWLKARSVPARIAESMATILRADGLKAGRRK